MGIHHVNDDNCDVILLLTQGGLMADEKKLQTYSLLASQPLPTTEGRRVGAYGIRLYQSFPFCSLHDSGKPA
jgi:hypothetical protein